MRKALELIASGEGPQGGFLTRLQMIGIARDAVAPISQAEAARMQGDELRAACKQNGWDVCERTQRESGAIVPENLEARPPGYWSDDFMWVSGCTAPAPEMPLPPLIVRDLLK